MTTLSNKRILLGGLYDEDDDGTEANDENGDDARVKAGDRDFAVAVL